MLRSPTLLVEWLSHSLDLPAWERLRVGITSHKVDSSPVLLNYHYRIERSEMEMLGQAKVSIDIALYSFTDRARGEKLGRLARSGELVRVYSHSTHFEQENQHGMSTAEILLSAGVQVKVKASRDLVHLRS